MKHFNKKKVFDKLYKEMFLIYTLHKVEQEALYTCYDENKDFGHIFALDNILSSKFDSLLNEMKKYASDNNYTKPITCRT